MVLIPPLLHFSSTFFLVFVCIAKLLAATVIVENRRPDCDLLINLFLAASHIFGIMERIM